VAKPSFIQLPGVEPIPILYEDRSVLAIDKPRGWMLVPFSWQKTQRNLQAALVSSIGAGDFWARSRGLKFLRFVHRLDADTTGVMLFAKSQGAMDSYSALFESRRMEKKYLAVVHGVPKKTEWICRLSLGPDEKRIGRQRVDAANGKEAETEFRVLQVRDNKALIEALPYTGRTHQIRVHLAAAGHPCLGDDLYGKIEKCPLGLRAVWLAFPDPFTRKRIEIAARTEVFHREFGFPMANAVVAGGAPPSAKA
jgi:23S rRNA pseudouridine1911/1915/1917 synthase